MRPLSSSAPPHADPATPPTVALADLDPAAVQRRTLRVVVAAQVLGGAGLAAGVTVGALLAQQMLGSEGLAGLPAALFTLGSAATAYAVGRISQRHGRRVGLGFGFTAGALGALGVVLAAAWDNVPLLFASLFVYGAGTATNLQARYAGADLATATTRGRAISLALVSTTAGAVAGPNLVEPLGHLADALGLPTLSGPFLLAAVAYAAAGATLFAFLRPDPLLLARRLEPQLALGTVPTAGQNPPLPATDPARPPARMASGVHAGATVMVLTQVCMVAIMTMTPVHLRHHQHGLGAVGLVIGLHIAAMYLPSPLTGRMVDRWGAAVVATASGAALLAAGTTAALAPGDSLSLSVAALMLLGLGWNLGLIAGTALVVDGTTLADRPRVQGNIDVLVALSGAVASVASGVVVAWGSYPLLTFAAGALALLLLPALRWTRSRQQHPA